MMTQQRHKEAPAACIWTQAGILRDRLCDRGFACDSCPLDAALRRVDTPDVSLDAGLTFETVAVSVPEGVASLPPSLVQPFLRMDLCNECRYSPNHVWLRRDYSSQFWCGLDAFAAALLPEDAIVVSAASGTRLETGEPCAWIYSRDLAIPISSPIPGTLSAHRRANTATAVSIASAPYAAGALFAIVPENGGTGLGNTRSALEQASHLRHDARRLLSGLTRVARQHENSTGICLNDGGEVVHSIRDLLGDKAWSAFLRGFLCPAK
jgi:glycine cleavage system H lipoate-binding protein